MKALNIGPCRVPGLQTILLVEDNIAASRGLARILTASGYRVDAVEDGASALDVLRAGPAPDFVLTDLRLPDLDGRELARIARRIAPSASVALITGWDLEPDELDHSAWGIDWVLKKPVNIHELLACLNSRERTAANAEPTPRSRAHV